MNEPGVSDRSAADEGSPLIGLATLLLRRRRAIAGLAFVGGVAGLALGLSARRQFASTATFIPQGSESSTSGFAAAASQLGIRIPTSSNSAWGPAVYVELLTSPALLQPILYDTVTVAELQHKRTRVVDLLRVAGEDSAQRDDAGIKELQKMIVPYADLTLGAVKVTVRSPWASVSYSLAQTLLDALNRYNVEIRKSQATSERQFVEIQAQEADTALRDAEARLVDFQQRNRAIAGSPDLQLELDRLQREVSMRQQLYVSLLQNRDEARIREVRDTPVISVLEYPRLAIIGEPRGSIRKAILGALAGAIIGTVLAFLVDWFSTARQSPTGASRDFLNELQNAIPLLRRTAQ